MKSFQFGSELNLDTKLYRYMSMESFMSLVETRTLTLTLTNVNTWDDRWELILAIDPRADDWYVNAITSYCERLGLDAKPVKSSLYERDPHLGIARRYVPVRSE